MFYYILSFFILLITLFKFCRYCGYVQENPAGEDNTEDGEMTVKKDGIVVFFSPAAIFQMQCSNEIFVDGTFQTCPTAFKQIVFIQAKQAGQRAVPVVFALLSKKVRYFILLINPFFILYHYKYYIIIFVYVLLI